MTQPNTACSVCGGGSVSQESIFWLGYFNAVCTCCIEKTGMDLPDLAKEVFLADDQRPIIDILAKQHDPDAQD